MTEWERRPLGELTGADGFAIGPFGSRMKTHDYVDSGVAVVRGQNILPGGRIGGDFVHVSDDFAAGLSGARLRAGDIALPHRGAIGRAALVKGEGYIMSTSLMRVRLDTAVADPSFVTAFLSSPLGEREILQFASTVGTPGIGQPLTSLRRVSVPVPPIKEQRRIAGVLCALDDLIDHDRRLIGSLEALVSAEFERLGFDAEPNGTSVLLSDLVTINPKLRKPGGDAAYVDMASLPTDSSRITRVVRRAAAGGARFQNGDALLARLTPCLENGKAAFVDVLEDDEIGVGSTEFIVLRDAGMVGPHWAYLLTRSPRFREYAIRHMNGSSGRQRCSADSIEKYEIQPPSAQVLATFRPLAHKVFEGIASLSEEVDSLTHTRDALLPLLMSGRVRVGDVEGLVA